MALVADAGLPLVEQHVAAPERNHTERLFQERRRAVEGVLIPTMDDNAAAVEHEQDHWPLTTARVKRLAGW